MLSMATTSASSNRRRPRPAKGDAWRRRSPAVAHAALEAPTQSIPSPNFELDAFFQRTEAFKRPERRVATAFRHMTFPDSDGDEESDYVPSEGDEEEEEGGSEQEGEAQEDGAAELDEETPSEAEEEEEEEEPDHDSRWWSSSEEKQRWERRYRKKDSAFRRRFGCSIDTPALPETIRKLKKEKPRHQAYKVVLVVLVAAYLVHLAVVYSASSWAFSMVTWRPSITEEADGVISGNAAADTGMERQDASTTMSVKSTASSQQQVSEHVRTGLQLCSTLARKVAKSQHDVTATQHALRACDIAVKFAPQRSREAIEAHVLRGDLRSLLSRFDSADEDYQAAWLLVEDVESSSSVLKLPQMLQQELDIKIVANRWTQLYKDKNFKELRQEAKSRVTTIMDPEDTISELASDWLHAFKRDKPVLEVLTHQRSCTLRRLTYEAVDDEGNDNRIEPDRA